MNARINPSEPFERRSLASLRLLLVLATGMIALASLAITGCDLGRIDLTESRTVNLRVENAASETAEVAISTTSTRLEYNESTGERTTATITEDNVVRVPAGETSNGLVPCGEMLTLTVRFGESAAITLTGDGTGTLGFDEGSVGPAGERFLVLNAHLTCDDTILIALPRSDQGAVTVVPAGQNLPDPIPDDADDQPAGDNDPTDPDDGINDGDAEEPEVPEGETVELVVANQTESTIQVRFSAGDGSLAGGTGAGELSRTEVRVPPISTTVGEGTCAPEYIVSASHLEATSSVVDEGSAGVNFHGVVLFGDGTGTSGFDSVSVAVSDGRLLERDVHFACDQTITVTVEATNNQVATDDEGNAITDEFGNPEIQYNVGVGRIDVTGN